MVLAKMMTPKRICGIPAWKLVVIVEISVRMKTKATVVSESRLKAATVRQLGMML